MDYFIDGLKKYSDFTGRATRKEYWMFCLFYMIFYIGAIVLDSALGTQVLAPIYSLVLLVPCLSIGARRLHDTSRSGWWQLISFVPLIGFIILIVFMVQDSHEDNKYGATTKLTA